MRTSGRALVVLLLLPQLLLLGLGGRLVLCVAPDGHLVVEAAGSACCDASAHDDARPAPTLAPAGAHGGADCGACTDIEIAFLREATAASVGDGPPPASDVARDCGPHRAPPRALARVTARPPAVSPRFERLRGTVLRC